MASSLAVPSEASTGSAVPRRVLGQHLRSLRQQAGLTVKVAATVMEWSEPKLWRIETGQTVMRALDVEAMCAAYGAPPDITQALTELARQTKAHGWWHTYGVAIAADEFSIYTTLEDAACALDGYAALQVPSLLRTELYARALVTSRNPSSDEAGWLVHQSLVRRVLVTRAKAPLAVTFALDEALVRRPVGGPAVMAGQLRYLAELAVLPNVCLRVLPFGGEVHPGLATGTFTLLNFPPSNRGADTDTAIVYASGLTGELYLDKPHELDDYRDAFAAILGGCLDEAATQDLLLTVAKELDP
jgi:transcriptional regulator with XRE-family HTH domain